ncbi:MAG TPA: hypothetical protein VMY43_07410 [Methanothrix sp.]|nr:hypothetical protein [Methanothrix sp.]
MQNTQYCKKNQAKSSVIFRKLGIRHAGFGCIFISKQRMQARKEIVLLLKILGISPFAGAMSAYPGTLPLFFWAILREDFNEQGSLACFGFSHAKNKKSSWPQRIIRIQ